MKEYWFDITGKVYASSREEAEQIMSRLTLAFDTEKQVALKEVEMDEFE
jgi:hypothetical protein